MRDAGGAVELDGERHRHRHSGRRAAADVRALPSRRERARPQPRRQRHRPRARQRAGEAARRLDRRARARSGEGTTFTVSDSEGTAHLPPSACSVATVVAGVVACACRRVCRRGAGAGCPRQPEAVRPSAGTCRRVLARGRQRGPARVRATACSPSTTTCRPSPTARPRSRPRATLRPDLIISDVMMPRLDGFGLIRELRADPQLRAMPVILLSARAGEEARVEGLGSGADDYLVKPFSARELLVRVGTLVRSAELHGRPRKRARSSRRCSTKRRSGVYLVDDDFRIAAVNPVALPVFGEIPISSAATSSPWFARALAERGRRGGRAALPSHAPDRRAARRPRVHRAAPGPSASSSTTNGRSTASRCPAAGAASCATSATSRSP